MQKRGLNLIVIIHTLFWLSFVFLNLYISVYFFSARDAIFRFFLITLVNAPIYYICTTWLVSELYEKKKYFKYLFFNLTLFALASTIRFVFEPLIVALPLITSAQPKIFLVMIYISEGTIVLIASLLGIARYKFNTENKLTELQLNKAETDLELIKAKINPHFLLNTLNNIYAQSYSEKSRSSEAILNLSQLLQYTIYETAKKKIPVEKEMQMIKSLIGLYQLKYQNRLDISINYNADTIPDSLEIPPMIFFSLVENAIKHSTIGLKENAFIRLYLHLNTMQLIFSVENNLSDTPQHTQEEDYKGFGLSTLKMILDNEYQNRYHVSILSDNHIYTTLLTITL